MVVMHLRIVVLSTVLAGCFVPSSDPPQYYPAQPYAYPPPQAAPQPAPSAQPAPAPAPAPAAPAPVAPAATDTSGPAPPVAAPPAPAAALPPPAPYPAPTSPYPPPPYAAYPPPPPSYSDHHSLHDGEVICDFAVVGTLAVSEILIKDSFNNNAANTLLVMAGIGAGGAGGYLLTEKYPVDAGAARATTTGLLLGITNGALLIQPTGANDAGSVVGLLLLGSAIGTGGGFAYGQATHLTSGQSLFIDNMILLGAATSLISVTIQNTYGTAQNTAMLIGVDGAAALGAILAPKVNWSPHRARMVLAGTAIGAFIGGSIAALATNQQNQANGKDADTLAAGLTAGLWGGFGLSILLTKDELPDPRFAQPPPAAPPTIAPMVGPQGTFGIMTGGSF
jgi:hypothetical protein